MDSRRYRYAIWGIIMLFILLMTIPYLYADLVVSGDHSFGGFLLNPIDGNSYLAKMKQGYEGNWQFHLPYTSEIGAGSYLFVYYLLLGHIARIFNVSLLVIFHLARLFGAIMLGSSLYSFCRTLFSSQRSRLIAFSLSLFGSGLGWIALLFGTITSDMWVAEAYPFLSTYINPHFSLGLALQLWLLNIKGNSQVSWRMGVNIALAAALLAEIAVFAIPVVIVIFSSLLLWKYVERSDYKPTLMRLFWVSFGSAPIVLYDLWIINSDPILSSWNAQNITSSPPIWDLIISMSPAIFVAVWWLRNSRPFNDDSTRLLLVWLVVCFGLLYIPFNLQRRFLTGYFVPLALLSAHGLEHLLNQSEKRNQKLGLFLYSISLPTNLIVLLIGVFGVQSLDSQIVHSTGELSAYEWMDDELVMYSMILASPDTGLYIPAYTSLRVMYGHPLETINAVERESELIGFYTTWDLEEQSTYIYENQINFVLLGPRERALGEIQFHDDWSLVYERAGIKLYRVN